MLDRSKVMTQTERDILVLQVWGWAWGWQPHPVKLGFVSKPQLKPRKGERRLGRPWPENGPNRHRRTRRRKISSFYFTGSVTRELISYEFGCLMR
jgi:hypothetical protein